MCFLCFLDSRTNFESDSEDDNPFRISPPKYTNNDSDDDMLHQAQDIPYNFTQKCLFFTLFLLGK